jgi:hypothetical protein
MPTYGCIQKVSSMCTQVRLEDIKARGRKGFFHIWFISLFERMAQGPLRVTPIKVLSHQFEFGFKWYGWIHLSLEKNR